MKKNEFANIMNKTAIIYGKTLTKDFLAAYWEILKDLDTADFNTAMNAVCRTKKFFPKPVEILELIKPPIEYMAQQQAGYLVACLEGVGYRNPEGWDEDPTTKRLLDGQFSGIYKRALESDIKWIEKAFIEAYQEISEYVELDEKLKINIGPEVEKLTDGIG